jgi:hypothetical protein
LCNTNKNNALKGWKKRKESGRNATAEKPQSENNAIKKREDKRRKEKKRENIPTFENFKSFALEKTERLKRKLNNDLLKLKYDAWIENDWKDGNDNPIKNWKTKLLNTLQYLSEEKQKTGYKILWS